MCAQIRSKFVSEGIGDPVHHRQTRVGLPSWLVRVAPFEARDSLQHPASAHAPLTNGIGLDQLAGRTPNRVALAIVLLAGIGAGIYLLATR